MTHPKDPALPHSPAPVTLIEDPYGWATPAGGEAAEASASDELPAALPGSDEFLARPSAAEENALARLEQAIQAAPGTRETFPTTPEVQDAAESARLLAAQIAEDQQLAESLQERFPAEGDAPATGDPVEVPLVTRRAEDGRWVDEELQAALETLFFLSDRPLARERLLKALRGGEKAAASLSPAAGVGASASGDDTSAPAPTPGIPSEVTGESLQSDFPTAPVIDAAPETPPEADPSTDLSDLAQLDEALASLRARYSSPAHGFELREIDGGFQLRTKPRWAGIAKRLIRVQTQRLSSGAMETLAIISYRQPVLKDEIDKIRGVDSSYFVRGLLDRKLVQMTGRSELPGRPILYGTTPQFLELFGLPDTAALPPLHELERMVPQSQAGAEEGERELDPRVREMRRMVAQMKSEGSEALLKYDPREDERFLTEIRERVKGIPTSTPSLDAQRQAERDAQQAEQQSGSGKDEFPL